MAHFNLNIHEFDWDEIPAIFTDPQMSQELTRDTEWRLYHYTVQSNAIAGVVYEFNGIIKFTKHDNTFKKVIRLMQAR